jgi:hypothetical protein
LPNGTKRLRISGIADSEFPERTHDCERTEDTAPRRLELARFAPCRKRVCFRRLDGWKQKTAALAALNSLARERALLLSFCILLSSCRSRQSVPGPSIEFTRVPPAEEGGPDTVDIIEGRVIGAGPGQLIVLYAKNGPWWVQPLRTEPFTRLSENFSWTNSTHVGTDYAALIVEPGYLPAETMNALPAVGGKVLAVASAKGGSSGPSVTKTLIFSGYQWRLRDAPSNRGGMNNYSSNNAWTDSTGALHLRVAKVSGQWTCAEVSLTRTLGYGTYSFVVRDISHLEPSAVFTMFTWDYAGVDQNYREMDIEVTQWGDPNNKNAQYVVKPFYVPENVVRFTLPPGVLTFSFHWEPGRVSFSTVRGSGSGTKSRPIAQYVFTSGVPDHGIETVRMNLYFYRSGKAPLKNGDEVIIEKFEYLP